MRLCLAATGPIGDKKRLDDFWKRPAQRHDRQYRHICKIMARGSVVYSCSLCRSGPPYKALRPTTDPARLEVSVGLGDVLSRPEQEKSQPAVTAAN